MDNKSIVSTRGTNWKPFKGDVLPQSALEFLEKGDALKYHWSWLTGCIFYQGETPETATNWIIVNDNGGFYKVNAQYAFWHKSTGGNTVLQCVWSISHLKKTLKNFIKTGQTLFDPGYTT